MVAPTGPAAEAAGAIFCTNASPVSRSETTVDQLKAMSVALDKRGRLTGERSDFSDLLRQGIGVADGDGFPSQNQIPRAGSRRAIGAVEDLQQDRLGLGLPVGRPRRPRPGLCLLGGGGDESRP